MTSLGVLYDFTGNSANTTVQFVADMVKEQWVSTFICVRSEVLNISISQVCGSHRRGTRCIPFGRVCSKVVIVVFSDMYLQPHASIL